ncbi:unnamed protein product [Brassica napus]|uniref:(rape) hypothetical protein n=1 Tax=Brassica napus TaxID=3708 RepID=A0A816ISS1_BRANA|nr:unnamed protein product [Brassica napus]
MLLSLLAEFLSRLRSFLLPPCDSASNLSLDDGSMIASGVANIIVLADQLSLAETLQVIISKHGDIAASSKLQSNVTRSYYLESLAAVVMELRTSRLKDLTKTRVAEMAAVVKDMESVKIEVSWLKKAVAELGEAVEYAGEYEAAKAEREACERSDSFFRDFFIFNLFFDVEEKLTQRILITYISYFILLFL